MLRKLNLELAYFSGRAWFGARGGRDSGGAGIILRFERVRPSSSRPGPAGWFQPSKRSEITPRFLDRTIRALKRWEYDIIGMDEVCRRSVILDQPRRFVCLTFDGCHKDLATWAYPVLSRHGAPFVIYVPTAFPDGLGEAWRLALESIIAREARISLMIDRTERHFTIRSVSEKYELYEFLESWMRQLAPSDLSLAINDLCKRYSVDLAALSRDASMDWADLSRLAADPLVTIGSATVNSFALANLKEAAALREMTMGRAVAEAALRREVRHFSYPFGDRSSFRRAHVVMAEEAGFASAVSAIPGVVEAAGRTNLRALPRVAWDGRVRSLRAMRVLLSGVTFAPVQPTRRADGDNLFTPD
ncbi:polysaccharide deacetylase family protein [Bradyrhizobium sp.]|uniref:polysaccharide deacetylase family protein n=1 Tax=Bradyrhizobium sp. TaxID=376 RepID=UPI003C3E9231